jgi:hypothetical protein
MAHGFGLAESVTAYLDGFAELSELALARPTCCEPAIKGWRNVHTAKCTSCPWNCKNEGWGSEGYAKAAKFKSAIFDQLDAPLHKVLFAKFFDQHHS